MIRYLLFGLSLLAVGLGIAAPPAAEARLVAQRIEGVRRICSYDAPRTVRTREGVIDRAVGRGEPCPLSDPGPERPARRQIPSLATLAGSEVVRNQRICTYVYMGRSYLRPMRPNEICPRTPHF